MLDQWTHWHPSSDLSKNYHLESFIAGIHKFEIILSQSKHEGKKVHIVFEENALAYRHSKRTLRAKALSAIEHRQGKIFLDWTFFKVTNSTYLQFLSKNSCEIYMPENLVHFIFLTQDDLLEVVDTAGADPFIESKAPSGQNKIY